MQAAGAPSAKQRDLCGGLQIPPKGIRMTVQARQGSAQTQRWAQKEQTTFLESSLMEGAVVTRGNKNR